MKKIFVILFFVGCVGIGLWGQKHDMHTNKNQSTGASQKKDPTKLPFIEKVAPQPLLAQAVRLQKALTFLGSALTADDIKAIQALQLATPSQVTVHSIQSILDPYCLAMVNINPEARVKVSRGPAQARLIQGGWKTFLVKVHNEAHVTSSLEAESPNAMYPFQRFEWDPKNRKEQSISQGQIANRFLELLMYKNNPMLTNLSGLELEYAVVQLYSRESGPKEAEIGFNVGQGTQDIGFRNSIPVLFQIAPAVKVILHVKDDDGTPAIGSFTISDGVGRLPGEVTAGSDFRLTAANREFNIDNALIYQKGLTGIYPLPSRRVAEYDEYPDFYFHPQIYRADGEHVYLPPGNYNVKYTHGPEYLTLDKQITVPAGTDSMDVHFEFKRWINLPKLGWYNGDHHIHGAGCSHYEMPEEGVDPKAMWRQTAGEDINIGSSLAWAPSWYHQKTFFTGKDETFSTQRNILHNDVEVSGFPSSDNGHLVLLRLKEDDYPGTKKIEDWPSWTLPILKWAKSQNGVVGYSHSGWGLEPLVPTTSLPNYITPKMDGIGANEFIVTVTENAIDFYSGGDTPAPWELNMWYHSLNCGFRPRLSGETDFPCIFDERVGLARGYFKTDEPLSYDGYVNAIKAGRMYVSEGRAHILDFSVNGTEVGIANSELGFVKNQTAKISAKVAAMLPEQQDEVGEDIAKRPPQNQPYWHIERSRVGKSRKVYVELIVNGFPVDSTLITADGQLNTINFSYPMSRSGWIALRIYPSAHTNPIFILVDKQPIRELKSAEWCRKAVDQCWKMKEPRIRQEEKAEAMAAYDRARRTYEKIIVESGSR